MALRPWVQELGQMLRVHLDLTDLTPEQKKQSSLRVAKVLAKILRDDRLDEETKERSKVWAKRAAHDPQITRMFRDSDEPGIEAFFHLPEEQQLDVVAGVPKPPITQVIDYLKDSDFFKEEAEVYRPPEKQRRRIDPKGLLRLIAFCLFDTPLYALQWFLVIPPYIMHISVGLWIMFLCAVMVTLAIILF